MYFLLRLYSGASSVTEKDLHSVDSYLLSHLFKQYLQLLAQNNVTYADKQVPIQTNKL